MYNKLLLIEKWYCGGTRARRGLKTLRRFAHDPHIRRHCRSRHSFSGARRCRGTNSAGDAFRYAHSQSSKRETDDAAPQYPADLPLLALWKSRRVLLS
ncbi:MAG: hypothetical protein F9K38_14800 [Pseudorhodoplanes sp.]|nr:MAG: hypothetical protein F9K38_14800 [Pseudorhodoplanes sp.]